MYAGEEVSWGNEKEKKDHWASLESIHSNLCIL